jgi:hypothetical protein
MSWMRGWFVAVVIAGALTTSAWAQNEPPCRLGFRPFRNTSDELSAEGVPSRTGAPFLATVKWTLDQQLADGNAIHAVKLTRLARDSAGRTRFENPMGCDRGEDGQLHARTDITLYDPATKTTTVWTVGFTSEKVANVTHQPAPVARPAPTAEEQAEVAERQREAVERQKVAAAEISLDRVPQTIHLGTITIGGVSADGTRYVETISADSEGNKRTIEFVREYWRSKDLLRTVKMVMDNPMSGRSAFELQDISRQEPDASLFQVPAGYTVKDQSPVPASR